jgi:hypothetical protein
MDQIVPQKNCGNPFKYAISISRFPLRAPAPPRETPPRLPGTRTPKAAQPADPPLPSPESRAPSPSQQFPKFRPIPPKLSPAFRREKQWTYTEDDFMHHFAFGSSALRFFDFLPTTTHHSPSTPHQAPTTPHKINHGHPQINLPLTNFRPVATKTCAKPNRHSGGQKNSRNVNHLPPA